MMRDMGIDTKVTITVKDLLEKLRENRTRHKAIVAEAATGFIKKAQKKLEDELERLKKAKPGKYRTVAIHLSIPQDMTTAYDTIIGMIERHTGAELEITASEYRRFYEDQWDWQRGFLLGNSEYSVTASRSLSSDETDGMDVDEAIAVDP